MTEHVSRPDDLDEPSDAPENPDLVGLDASGRDRSSDYSVDQAQAHQNADEGRERIWDASDPVD